MYFRKRMGLDGLKLGANVEIGQNKVSFRKPKMRRPRRGRI